MLSPGIRFYQEDIRDILKIMIEKVGDVSRRKSYFEIDVILHQDLNERTNRAQNP